MYIMKWDEVNFNPYRNMTSGSHIRFSMKLGVLTIFMGKPEVLVGKWFNGSCHFIWEASENMGCDLRQFNFLLFLVCSAELVILRNRSFPYRVKFYSFVFTQISTGVVCVNSSMPHCFLKKVLVTLASWFSYIYVYVCWFTLAYKFNIQ